jgi:hypothetical protein
MMEKITISISDRALSYLNDITDNRSKYINDLIEREQKKVFEKKLEADYREQSKDPEWQAEVKLWDCTTEDGLDDSVEGMVRFENSI